RQKKLNKAMCSPAHQPSKRILKCKLVNYPNTKKRRDTSV
ncbi:2Fe-2S iron-sulfur cluster binding domain protein, partial [Vibrio parahaemolyticus VP2007-007]